MDATEEGTESGHDPHRIKKNDFEDGLLPAVAVYGRIHSDESYPDGVYLFVGNEVIRRAVYGYGDGTGGPTDQPHGYRVIADISSLDVGCHDITIRAAHGDRYGDIPVKTLCIDP